MDEAKGVLSNKNTNQSAYVIGPSQLYKSLGEEEKASQYFRRQERQGYNHLDLFTQE